MNYLDVLEEELRVWKYAVELEEIKHMECDDKTDDDFNSDCNNI